MGKKGFDSETAKKAGSKSKRGKSTLTVIRQQLVERNFNEDTFTAIWQRLEQMAVNGEMDAIKTYLGYVLGKPQQFMDVTTNGDSISIIIQQTPDD